ncbi:MAG: hypothetical protein IID44_32380 [Planctomycetes bacterium]|nr:hypothetical protein [Planctomycetota bacterium]
MKCAVALLLVCCWMVSSASAELIITTDTTIDFRIGLIGGVEIFDGPNSPTTVDIVEGGIVGTDIRVHGNSVLNHRGGHTGGVIYGLDNSTINVYGGLVASDDIVMLDQSVANIYGGHFGDDIEASDSATVHLYGGTFEKANSGASLSVQQDGVISANTKLCLLLPSAVNQG